MKRTLMTAALALALALAGTAIAGPNGPDKVPDGWRVATTEDTAALRKEGYDAKVKEAEAQCAKAGAKFTGVFLFKVGTGTHRGHCWQEGYVAK